MAGDLNELSVSIGRLQASVENLAKTVGEHRIESIQEHRKVHQIVDAMAEGVRNLTHTVAEMKPLTDDYREKRAEARGAKRLLAGLYAVAGGSVALAFGKLAEWWSAISARPHP